MILIFENKKSSKITKREIGYIDRVKIFDASWHLPGTSRNALKEYKENHIKNTDINVLLNRVKLNQKNESRKKIYFSAAASTGLLLFGLIIF